MATLIIASISERAGKTALAAALAVRMGSESSPVALGKASADRASDDSGIDNDATILAELLPENPSVSGPIDEIASNISDSPGNHDVVIIEGFTDVQANLQLAESTSTRAIDCCKCG